MGGGGGGTGCWENLFGDSKEITTLLCTCEKIQPPFECIKKSSHPAHFLYIPKIQLFFHKNNFFITFIKKYLPVGNETKFNPLSRSEKNYPLYGPKKSQPLQIFLTPPSPPPVLNGHSLSSETWWPRPSIVSNHLMSWR